MQKTYLAVNLRRKILQGHPWIFEDSLKKSNSLKLGVCSLYDPKKSFLAFGIYCPDSPLRFRVLSTDKSLPNQDLYIGRIHKSLEKRKSLLNDHTNCCRLINGEGDYLPGLVVDIYDKVAVMQFDGDQMYDFWDQKFIADTLLSFPFIDTVYDKSRSVQKKERMTYGKELDSEEVVVKENGLNFIVNIIDGQKTGHFLDQRDNRFYVSQFTEGKTGINFFSYTGGFSLFALLGKAKKIVSLDISKDALDLATRSIVLNPGLEAKNHEVLCTDAFKFIRDGDWKGVDFVILDPPNLTHSGENTQNAVDSYEKLFTAVMKKMSKDSHLFLSSCTARVNLEKFLEIIEKSLSQSRKTAQILRTSGQGSDHPYPHAAKELNYLKFVHLYLN